MHRHDRKPHRATVAALAAFLLFAALLGVSSAEASLPKGADVADLSHPALQLPAVISSEPSLFGFAEDLALLNVENAQGRFALFGVETCRFERTYARNNPLKLVDLDGLSPGEPPAMDPPQSAGGAYFEEVFFESQRNPIIPRDSSVGRVIALAVDPVGSIRDGISEGDSRKVTGGIIGFGLGIAFDRTDRLSENDAIVISAYRRPFGATPCSA